MPMSRQARASPIRLTHMPNKTQAPAPRGGKQAGQNSKDIIQTVSGVGPNGELIEPVFDPDRKRVKLCVWRDQSAVTLDSYSSDHATRYIPAKNLTSFIENDVLKLPSGPAEYGDVHDLIIAIRAHISRYVDVTDEFLSLAAHYVLLTWVYDRFRELPYLRRRGDYGTGKTRFLTVVGSLCYKPIFAGGASTVSPIFRMLHQLRGTLLIDEADFRFSDESALIAKILNSGNVDGFPVLRCESVNGKDVTTKAYKVFGPKIVAMRGRYDDHALESRFLTETNPSPTLRKDIPLNLPEEHEAEALKLRNRLLLYRFHMHERTGSPFPIETTKIEPRMRQILAPLLAVTPDEIDRETMLAFGELAQDALSDARGQSVEAELLTVLRKLMENEAGVGVPVSTIAKLHGRAFFDSATKPLSPRGVGAMLRSKLNLRTRKSNGVYVVPKDQKEALDTLYARFAIDDDDVGHLRECLGELTRVEVGDVRDIPRTATTEEPLNR